MKIVHISNSDMNGGAAIAACRINDALHKIGINSGLLVQKKLSNRADINSFDSNIFSRMLSAGRFLFDEILIRSLTIQSRGRFSFPIWGADIVKNRLVTEADVINLHWINGGFLSMKSLSKLQKLNKSVVWTLHDMWAFTGGCHYNNECDKYVEQCFNCPSLKLSSKFDQSRKIFDRKAKLFEELNLNIITCSNWLSNEVKKSKLLKSKRIEVIPNPVDLDEYKPFSKISAREKFGFDQDKMLLMIGAMNLKDKRKGFNYLIEALSYIHKNHKEFDDKIELITFGKHHSKQIRELPYKANYFGKIKDESQLVDLYNSVDVYIAPSLQDNLPNTVVESISCGTPVIAFNIGGMPDMIDHLKNGYLSKFKSSEDLANGVITFLTNSELMNNAKLACRLKAEILFDENKIAGKYKSFYDSILS
ncbi:MAG: glycosyltransferase family 4 protein [Ignavibacteria bacterium]|jgi:glycosyltransferase involved in cell wall biosynthesis